MCARAGTFPPSPWRTALPPPPPARCRSETLRACAVVTHAPPALLLRRVHTPPHTRPARSLPAQHMLATGDFSFRDEAGRVIVTEVAEKTEHVSNNYNRPSGQVGRLGG